jgi:2Fe-2S ferredoxin
MKAVFIEHNGTEHVVEATAGKSLMQLAMEQGVPGIIADCGGSASCGTCLGYVEAPWFDQLKPASADEMGVLEGVLHYQDNSRLTCQIIMSAELDGIRIDLPESQI